MQECEFCLVFLKVNYMFECVFQLNVFLSRLSGEPIGFTVLGIFVIDRSTILTVGEFCTDSSVAGLYCKLFVQEDGEIASQVECDIEDLYSPDQIQPTA